MSNTEQALNELRQAEAHLTRALNLVGMTRGKQGYIAPAIAVALEDVRLASRNIDAPVRRRSWSRLARR